MDLNSQLKTSQAAVRQPVRAFPHTVVVHESLLYWFLDPVRLTTVCFLWSDTTCRHAGSWWRECLPSWVQPCQGAVSCCLHVTSSTSRTPSPRGRSIQRDASLGEFIGPDSLCLQLLDIVASTNTKCNKVQMKGGPTCKGRSPVRETVVRKQLSVTKSQTS